MDPFGKGLKNRVGICRVVTADVSSLSLKKGGEDYILFAKDLLQSSGKPASKMSMIISHRLPHLRSSSSAFLTFVRLDGS